MNWSKTLAGLEHCLSTDYEHCVGCPFVDHRHGYNCIRKLMADAIESLRNGARVITLEEALGGDECWIEWRGGGCGYADCYISDGLADAKIYRCGKGSPEYANLLKYNKWWRCWDIRPSQYQREHTPWQE